MLTPASDYPTAARVLLLLGLSGAGKSTVSSMLPSVAYLDFDMNLQGPILYAKSQGKTDLFIMNPYLSKTGKPVGRGDLLSRAGELVVEAVNDDRIQTISIASLTGFRDAIECKVRKQQGRKIANEQLGILDEQLTKPDWGHVKSLTRNFFVGLITGAHERNKTIVIEAHVKVDKDEITGAFREFIGYPGQSAHVLASLCTDIWLLTNKIKSVNGVKTEERMITCAPTASQAALCLRHTGDMIEFESTKENIYKALNISPV